MRTADVFLFFCFKQNVPTMASDIVVGVVLLARVHWEYHIYIYRGKYRFTTTTPTVLFYRSLSSVLSLGCECE